MRHTQCLSLLVLVHSYSGCMSVAAPGNSREKEVLIMRKQRDLQVCHNLIRVWLMQGGHRPEQMDALVRVQKKLRQLRRLNRLDKQDVYEAVRVITEELIEAFGDHDQPKV